jgi:Cu+-exporting ATPase
MSSQYAGGKALPILQGPAEQKDPVCGMTVVPERAAGKAEHAGKTYYFCSKGCAERFSDDPEKFLAASRTG